VGTPVVGGDGTVYVASDDRNLYAVRPDGSMLWALPLSGPALNPPTIGADGTLYLTTTEGELLAIGQ
jgi:outer membrane protein assembly factor BamB